jgi:glycine dehydrogenase
MLAIKAEVNAIESGALDMKDNMLKNAPHTASMVIAEEWNHAYTRNEAAYPLPYVRAAKFWPTVGRVNNTHGDRNLICACLPIEAYMEK